MNKLILWTAPLLCSCILMVACKDDGNYTDPMGERDNTLAGSVAFDDSKAKTEGSFDGTSLGIQKYDGHLLTYKDSDNEISIIYYSIWEDTSFKVMIPAIPLSGVPYSATFDYSCRSAKVSIDFTDAPDALPYDKVNASVKGWIEKVGFDHTKNDTRNSPAVYEYNFDITMECNVDGRILRQRITDSSW